MNEFKIKINGNEYAVVIKDADGENALVSVNGAEYKVEMERKAAPKKVVKVEQPTVAVNAAPPAPKAPVAKPSAGSNNVLSPLPGVILEVYVKEGETVQAGQKVVMLEAMKMENIIESDFAGTVTKVNVSKGSNVLEGEVLITVG